MATRSAKGEFGLQKYFKSFQAIQENPKFKGRIKDVIICTNIGFDNLEDLKEKGVLLVPITEPDEILDFPKHTLGKCLNKLTII